MTSTIGTRPEHAARGDDRLALVTTDDVALSWEEVFDEFAPAISSYARSRGVREPEDVVQDVFVAAVQRLPSFEGDRSRLRSLLFTIAYRRIADEHRRRYRRPETLVAEHSPTPAPGPTIEEVIDLDESASEAMQAFAVLTVKERLILKMRIFEEASPAEVGNAFGLTSGNVRVIQARALAKIRNHLRLVADGSTTHTLPTGGMVFDFVRYLRTELPADDVLGPWIEEIRSNPSGMAVEDAASAASAALATGSLTATERAAEAVSTLAPVLGSGMARIGAVVSAIALTAVAGGPAVVGNAEPAAPSQRVSPVVEVHELERAQLPDPAGDSSLSVHVDPATDRIQNSLPTLPGIVAKNSPTSTLPQLDGFPDTALPAEAQVVPALGENSGLSLLDDVVEPLVDDLVVPLVEGTVDLLVDDVVVPLVDDLVVPLAEDTVDLLVGDVVEPLVDDVSGAVDGVVPGLGGLLGGLLGQ